MNEKIMLTNQAVIQEIAKAVIDHFHPKPGTNIYFPDVDGPYTVSGKSDKIVFEYIDSTGEVINKENELDVYPYHGHIGFGKKLEVIVVWIYE